MGILWTMDTDRARSVTTDTDCSVDTDGYIMDHGY